jgi:uncharacterized protein YcbK (DUF882 family)
MPIDFGAHFSEEELACPCCGACNVTQELVDALNKLRDLAGAPIVIDSGYRCAAHNAAIGGEPHSYHMQGMAADIRMAPRNGHDVARLADQIEAFHGFGAAPLWCHVDVRPTPDKHFWGYAAGRGIIPWPYPEKP